MVQQVLLLPLLGRKSRRSCVERIHPRRRRWPRPRIHASADVPHFVRKLSRRRSECRTRGRLQVQGRIRRFDHGRHRRARRRRRDRSESEHASASTSDSEWLRVVQVQVVELLGTVLRIPEGAWLGDRNGRRGGSRQLRMTRRRRRPRREPRPSSLREDARNKRRMRQLTRWRSPDMTM